MSTRIKNPKNGSLNRSIFKSAGVHILIISFLLFLPSLPLKDSKTTDIIWVQIPKGSSDEIGIGMKKSESLPQSTIEQQKLAAQSTPLEPEMKLPSDDKKNKNTKPKQEKKPKKAKPKKRLSANDKKIADALKMINRDLKERQAYPEAAQIKDNGEGFKYGTGTEPLKVLPNDPEYLKYQAIVRATIIQEWIVPLRYIEDQSVGHRCSIEVMINRDGEVISTKWENKSGDETFDSSAMRSVKKASPFPKPPERLEWEAYNEGFLIEFDPRLKP